MRAASHVLAGILLTSGCGHPSSQPSVAVASADITSSDRGSSTTNRTVENAIDGGSANASPEPTNSLDNNAQINTNIMKVLHDTLPSSQTTLDGDPVTGIQQTGECTATITTAKGNTAVSWRDLGNLAPTDDGRVMMFKIPAANVVHVLAAPVGQPGDHLNMALGVLDGNCSLEASG